MKNKIIFLDIDGVLNSQQFVLKSGFEDLKELPSIISMISEENVWCLNYIVNNVPDLKFVISSSWRKHHPLEEIKKTLSYFNFDSDLIIGKTPSKPSSPRSYEIYLWLEDNGGEESNLYAVLDDHFVYNTEQPGFFKTDPLVGLTYRDACNIIRYFNKEWKQPVINL